MSLFEKVPYTNFQELNLSEIVKFTNGVKKQLDKIDDSVAAAAASELGAAEHEAGAQAAQAAAEDAQEAAEAAAAEAAGSATNAAQSETNAAQSATNAAQSATNAQMSAAQAAQQATQAATSAQTAGQNASAAAQSAQAAAGSANSAATSADTATTAAQTASTQAGAAAASAAEAAESAGSIEADLTEIVRCSTTTLPIFTYNDGSNLCPGVIAFDCEAFSDATTPGDVPFCIVQPAGDISAAASPRGKYNILPTNYVINNNGHYIPAFEVYDNTTGAKAANGNIYVVIYIFAKTTRSGYIHITPYSV